MPTNTATNFSSESKRGLTLGGVAGKQVLLGLSYFDTQGELLSQRTLAGRVVKITMDDGITLQLSDGESEFIIPSDLSCWYSAPEGNYIDPETQEKHADPDYLVTWNVFQTQEEIDDGTHQWWEWHPALQPPGVGTTGEH